MMAAAQGKNLLTKEFEMTAGKKLGAALTLAFVLTGVGCSSLDESYGNPETTKNAIAEKFNANRFSITATTSSRTYQSGFLSECYTLRAIPDDGTRYVGCANASKYGGIEIYDLKGLNMPSR